MSLQRDVTANIPIVKAMEPVSNGSDLVELANLGVGLFKQQKQKEAQEAAALRQNDVLNTGQSLIDEYLNAVQQDPSGTSKYAMKYRQQVSGLDYTAEEKEVLLKQFNTSVGKSAGTVVQKNVESLVDQVDKEIRHLMSDDEDRADLFGVSPELVDKVSTGMATMEEKRTLIMQRNRIAANRAESENNRRLSKERVSQNAFDAARLMEQSINAEQRILSESINGIVAISNRIQKNPDVDSVQGILDQQQQMVNNLDLYKRQRALDWDTLISNARSEEDRKMLVDRKTRFENSFNSLTENFSKLDAEQFQTTTQSLKFMQDSLGLDAVKASPILFRMKEAYGPAFNAVMNSVIQSDAELLRQLRSKVSAGISEQMSAEEKMLLDMDTLTRLHTDKSLLDLSLEEKENMAGTLYSSTREYIETGIAADLPPTTKQNLGRNMSIILDMAVESGDVTQQERALELLNSPGYDKFVESLDSDTQANLKAMTTQFNMDVLTDRNQGLVQRVAGKDGVSYNANTGKFEYKPTTKPSATSGFAGTVPQSVGISETRKDVEKANQYLDKVVAGKDSDNFLKGLSDKEVKDWAIYSSEVKPKIDGELKDFGEEYFKASEKNIPVSELQEMEQKEVDERTSLELSQARIDELEKQLLETSKTGTQEEDLITALMSARDDEEALAIIKEIQKIRNGQ